MRFAHLMTTGSDVVRGLTARDGASTARLDVLLLCHDADRGISLRGRYYSPILDSVRDDLEQRGLACATVAYPWSTLVGNKAWGSPISVNRGYLVATLRDKARRLTSTTYVPHNQVAYYRNLLEHCRPSLVISIGLPPTLATACRTCNVACVEIMHAFGYRTLPWGWDRRASAELPGYVLTFDPVTTDTFCSLTNKGVCVLEIPHPFLKRFVNPQLLAAIPPEWSPNLYRRRDVKTILVALTWGYDGTDSRFANILPNGLYPEALEDAVRGSRTQINWLFRLHPVQMKNRRYRNDIRMVRTLCDKYENASWDGVAEAPLPALLSRVDGCLTMCSSAAYEAAYLGVPSLLLCPTLRTGGFNSKMFDDLVDGGFALKQEATLTSILSWAEQVQRRRPLLSNLENEQAWTDALATMMPGCGPYAK